MIAAGGARMAPGRVAATRRIACPHEVGGLRVERFLQSAVRLESASADDDAAEDHSCPIAVAEATRVVRLPAASDPMNR